MKFSEVKQEEWEQLRPYLDTCLLPVTGMSGSEAPYEAREALERLRDIMDLIEGPFRGRVVTYPASHYRVQGAEGAEALNHWCLALKQSGFKHVIVITANEKLSLRCDAADLIVRPFDDGSLPDKAEIAGLINRLWNGKAS
ncbi:DUF2487 family protein [Paenibacillus sp. HB172176]|uniref:DUF2487 family protein n=1 Tax=Paenibacillus sp. HB172176 TaxID=2493690 RepID=UPI001439E114|nr:DUF2487 family protein [Paenibacillus sp. HB172176]